MRRLLLLLFLSPLAACTCAQEPPVVTAPDTLPTPFTAEQIREAMPVGTSLVMQNTTPEGQRRERWDVRTADVGGMTLRTAGPLDAPSPTVTERRHAWATLRDHASFPSDTARRSRVTVNSPLSTDPLPAWRYDVPGDGGLRTVFLFADAFPGPPVRVETFRGDTVIATMSQIARSGSAAPVDP